MGRKSQSRPDLASTVLGFGMLLIDTLIIEDGYRLDYFTTAYDPDLFETGQRNWSDCEAVGDYMYNSPLIEEINNAFVLAITSAMSKGWRHSSLNLGDFLDQNDRIQDKSVRDFLNDYGRYYKRWKDFPLAVVRENNDQALLQSVVTENNSMCIRRDNNFFYLGRWPKASICGAKHGS